jgi:hypothetical protein
MIKSRPEVKKPALHLRPLGLAPSTNPLENPTTEEVKETIARIKAGTFVYGGKRSR